MNNKPLPCPFCGFPPVVEEWLGRDKRGNITIYCNHEFCSIGPAAIGRTFSIALQYWNTRDGKQQ